MPKRSNHEGNIRKRSDGRWEASLMMAGKRQYVYGKTRQEVVIRLQQLQGAAQRAGHLPNPGRRTVSDLLDAWLEVGATTLKPATLESYRNVCDTHIRPTIGTLHLSRLTPDVVQRLIAPLQKQDKTRTAVKVYRALHRACELAVLWGWLPSNPCDRILRPTHQPERRDVWAQDELRRFLDGAQEHPLYPLYLLLIASGLRLGEALALQWSDLDFTTRRLTVQRSVRRIRGEWVFDLPKIRSGIRTLALPAEVVHELRRHKARQAEARLRLGAGWHRRELVFTNGTGDVLHPSVVEHNLHWLCRQIGVPKMTPHGLPHLHASLLLGEGLPIPDVSRRLGHATPGVTMSIYAHSLGAREDEVAHAIGRMLHGTSGNV